MTHQQNPLRQWVKAGLRRAIPRRAFLVDGAPSSKKVYLTFDDGPHPEHTPKLLDVLDQLGIRATFFVVGKNAEKHPEIIRRMSAAGHAVGNHSYTHSEPDETSARHLLREVRQTYRLIHRTTGQSPRLFRPPKGKLTPSKLALSWATRSCIALWNIDPRDYERGDSSELAAYFKEVPLQAGDVVLLHDTHPHAALALQGAVKDARDRGLEFETLESACGLA